MSTPSLLFLKISIICSLLFLSVTSISAADPLNIVINEIAWMGRESFHSDEWIELYNNSSLLIDINGWKLKTEDGTPEVILEGKIPPKGFFLLERTDDTTLPNIKADLIYKGSLNNQGEYLKLIDKNGQIIDEIDCSDNWFEGDNETKRTMERKNTLVSGNDSENWQTSRNPGGTPKAENSLTPSQTSAESPKEVLLESQEKLEPIVYPSNIFLNEILPSPEGPDAENEWIEIFNGNNFEVDVSEWQIRDIIGATKTYTIPERTKIDPNSFLLLPRPETKITLQNSGDVLELLNPIGEVVHKANYPKAPIGQSFNRTLSGWAWSESLTPGETNITTQPEISKTDSSETSKEKEEGEKALARIGDESPKSSNPLIVFLIALTIAISSGIIVLFLKKRIKTEE